MQNNIIYICTKEINDVPAIAATADRLAVEMAGIVNAVWRDTAIACAIDIDVITKI